VGAQARTSIHRESGVFRRKRARDGQPHKFTEPLPSLCTACVVGAKMTLNLDSNASLHVYVKSVATPGSGARGARREYVSDTMTRSNTTNEVHVAATELPQLLSQNTNMFGEATAQSRCQALCSSNVN